MVKLVMPVLSKKLSPTFTYKAFPGKDEGPFVLIRILLNAAGVIPKKNFTPDVHSIKQMMNIISQGGCICIMPITSYLRDVYRHKSFLHLRQR